MHQDDYAKYEVAHPHGTPLDAKKFLNFLDEFTVFGAFNEFEKPAQSE